MRLRLTRPVDRWQLGFVSPPAHTSRKVLRVSYHLFLFVHIGHFGEHGLYDLVEIISYKEEGQNMVGGIGCGGVEYGKFQGRALMAKGTGGEEDVGRGPFVSSGVVTLVTGDW